MTSTELETRAGGLSPRVSQATRIGQGTAVEQARAVAEVEAQVIVAMRNPRSVTAAVEAMREECRQPRLAEKAFFRFPRGKDQNGKTIYINGASIHLARALARVWGNLDYGIAELRRDDEAGQSEMIAFCWDLQANTRNRSTFINPHVRDRRDGPERLTDMRDIYESNANSGARRVREAIFAILPTWFVEEAEDLCNETLRDGGGKTLAQRIADAIKAYAALGVTQGQLEAKLGRPSDGWIEQDIAQLQVIYRSLQRNEVSKDEEFPDDRVTAADIIGAPKTAGQERGDAPGGDAPDRRDPGRPVNGNEAAEAGQPEKNAGDQDGLTGPDFVQSPASPPVASPAKPGPVTKAAVVKLIARFPFKADDVGDFLTWRTGRSALIDLDADGLGEVAAYLEGMLAGHGDPEAAASAIWTEYRQAHPQEPAGD